MRLLFSFLLFTFSFASTAQIPSYVPTNGLLGWYPFNGNANDESLNGTNGTVNETTLTSDRNNINNAAYYFNGISSNIDLGINSAINSILNDFSISYWVKSENNGGSIFCSYSSSSQGGSNWRINSGIGANGLIALSYLVNQNWQSTYSSPYHIELNQWIHFTFTRSGGSTKIYINGIFTSSETLSALSLPNPTSPEATTMIGYAFPNTPNFNYFKGIIDDIGIWNRALTQEEITRLYYIVITPNTPEDTTSNVGIGTTTPKRKLHVNDVMRLEPRNTPPANPAKGDIYFDGVLNKLRVYDGSVWQSCW